MRYNKLMFVVGLISWWYGAGWKQQAYRTANRLMSLMDYFSIDSLLKTLFSPYRQISAGKVRGPVGVQLRAFFDRTFSRIIGAVVRTIVIIIGSFTIVVAAIWGIVSLLLWLVMPLLPVAGVVLWMMGWTPSW